MTASGRHHARVVSLAALTAALVAAVLPARLSPAQSAADPRASRFALVTELQWGTQAMRSTAAIGWHGGATTASNGEVVQVYVSDAYQSEPNTPLRWADFFTRLLHGSELQLVRVHVATLVELQTVCGDRAIGCFGGGELYLPGELAGSARVTPEEVARHEYGHHIGLNRENPPWTAIDWGTKRWASQLGICRRAKENTVYPGNEDWGYTLNPGEGLAESYRVLNEVRQGAATFSWTLVDGSFSPDATALTALEQDVLTPWTGQTAATIKGRFTVKGPKTRTWRLGTPLDGVFQLNATLPAGSPFRIAVLAEDGKTELARGLWSSAKTQTLAFTICGTRTAHVRVTRLGPPGTVTLRTLTP